MKGNEIVVMYLEYDHNNRFHNPFIFMYKKKWI